MTQKFSRIAATLASAAALSLVATPAMARDWGWGGAYGHRHNDGIDAGDVIAGILIIGGIAAIASAASKAGKDKRARSPNRYPDDQGGSDGYSNDSNRGYGSDNRDARPQWNGSNAFNTAVDRCVGEIELGKARVESVDSVNRDGAGWRVQGQVRGSGDFACSIDGDGRIRSVSIDGHAV